MESSQFTTNQQHYDSFEQLNTQGATSETFRVKLYGKLHFLKRLKAEYANDIRYQEVFRKEFETGYRLEHPNLVRYISRTDDGILMEYIDGETLTQRLANHPEFFKDKKNADKFLRQLLEVVGYLHSHQVLHLDLKPDNILLTRINDDVKLIDLGCCYTDTFTDTQGHTNRFAAPEQLTGESPDVRTDIYAIGRILELLPCHHIYNKVIARCTASDPSDRYQSTKEALCDINQKKQYYRFAAIFVAMVTVITIILILLTHQQDTPPMETPSDSIISVQKDTIVSFEGNKGDRSHDTVLQDIIPVSIITESSLQPSASVTRDATSLMEKELDRLMDSAYRSTIITFCDSVFPSLTVGRHWEKETSEFHAQALQSAAELSRKYPDIPESVIMQHVESRFQALTGYVFNKMRENGTKQ